MPESVKFMKAFKSDRKIFEKKVLVTKFVTATEANGPNTLLPTQKYPLQKQVIYETVLTAVKWRTTTFHPTSALN